MSSPTEILNARYGEIFLSKSKNINIVSAENGNGGGENFTVYTSLLETGTVNPVVIVALVEGSNNMSASAPLKDLNWSSLHVRSYNSWDELTRAGITIANNNPQRPVQGALQQFKDIQMRVLAENDNSKTYHFSSTAQGTMTLFTSKPTIATGGNGLPRETSFLPWLAECNFVYQRG